MSKKDGVEYRKKTDRSCARELPEKGDLLALLTTPRWHASLLDMSL